MPKLTKQQTAALTGLVYIARNRFTQRVYRKVNGEFAERMHPNTFKALLHIGAIDLFETIGTDDFYRITDAGRATLNPKGGDSDV